MLSAPVRATVSTTAGRATGTILDDDGPLRSAAFAALATADAAATKKK